MILASVVTRGSNLLIGIVVNPIGNDKFSPKQSVLAFIQSKVLHNAAWSSIICRLHQPDLIFRFQVLQHIAARFECRQRVHALRFEDPHRIKGFSKAAWRRIEFLAKLYVSSIVRRATFHRGEGRAFHIHHKTVRQSCANESCKAGKALRHALCGSNAPPRHCVCSHRRGLAREVREVRDLAKVGALFAKR